MSLPTQLARSPVSTSCVQAARLRETWICVGCVMIDSFVRALGALQTPVSADLRPAVIIMALATFVCWTTLRGRRWALWIYVIVSLFVWIVSDGGHVRLATDGSIVSAATVRPASISVLSTLLGRSLGRKLVETARPRVAKWRHTAHRGF